MKKFTTPEDFEQLFTDTIGEDLVDSKADIWNADHRLPAVLLIDTSGSMKGTESLLKSSVMDLYQAIFKDDTAISSVELGILSFSDTIEIIQPITEIINQEARGKNINFTCGGTTITGLALKTAIKQLEERKEILNKNGIKSYSPLLIVMSDGRPFCPDNNVKEMENLALKSSKEYIRKKVASNQLVAVSVEIGNKCDHRLMRELTGLNNDKHVFKVKNEKELANFFRMASSMMIRLSNRGTDTANYDSIEEMVKGTI